MQLTRSLRMLGNRERSRLRKIEGYKMTWPRWREKTRYETRQRFFMNLLFLLSIKLLNAFFQKCKGIERKQSSSWTAAVSVGLAKVALTIQPAWWADQRSHSSFSSWAGTSFLVWLFACLFGHRVTCSPSWPSTPSEAKESGSWCSSVASQVWEWQACHQAWCHLVFAAREHGFCWDGAGHSLSLGASFCTTDRGRFSNCAYFSSLRDEPVNRHRDILNGRYCKVLFVLVYYRIMLWRLMISFTYKNYFLYYSISTIL